MADVTATMVIVRVVDFLMLIIFSLIPSCPRIKVCEDHTGLLVFRRIVLHWWRSSVAVASRNDAGYNLAYGECVGLIFDAP
jgi:hypothetical protein